MKKYISIIVLFIIVLMQFAVLVQAAQPCSISLKPDNQTLSKSDVLTVDISMSNITAQDGVTGFLAILNYSKDKFDLVIDESEDAQDVLAELEGTDYEGCKVLYIGENDEDDTVLNPWTLLLVEGENEEVGIAGITNEAQKQTQKIAKLKFKVKDDVASSNSEKITLEDLTIIGASGDDSTIANAYTTVKISGSQTISIGTSNTVNKTNTNTNKNNSSVSNYNKTNTNINKNTPAQSNAEEVPEAGAPVILPIILVFVGIIIFKYRKYKEYKNI